MQLPPVGEAFSTEIDRISNNGNGIIEAQRVELNIGPVVDGCEGEMVVIERIHWEWGYCLTDEIKAANYETRLRKLLPSKIDDNVQFSKLLNENKTEHHSDKIDSHPNTNQSHSTQESDRDTNSTEVNKSDSEPDGISNKRSPDVAESEFENSNSKDKTVGVDTQSDNSENIDSLRKRAEEAATEEVPETLSTTSPSKSQYTRSQKIKEYVKARADGVCEGCGEPAPFTSKTGEPYLHAHHIHELSDGGSDTPDTVVALCPNCHYRVHHGEDGDEYNRELERKLDKIGNASTDE
jgi:predicted HNH restriction endonuclease